ncbi:PD-(D/E)XK nuclease family protein [Dyadobacter endophyticus]|uniref:PD-(D/E)XK nuclease family protein n=1 Tax=Dyadobacter endophyticus TaxID=1749036 RepID=UPI003CEF073D
MKEIQIPNIFKLATKELSQDAFFAWLLQWADQKYGGINPDLNHTAQDFVRKLIVQTDTYAVTTVEVGRQWHNIDVWAEINGEYFISIEDKTNTGRHSNQLARYKELVESEFGGKPHKLIFVYLKTGNESLSSLDLIKRQEGYTIIDRRAVLEILDTRSVDNDIFNDFRSYLTQLQKLTDSCSNLEAVKTDESAAQGFFLSLQELIPEHTDWNYVSNPSGGFWGFWYHWVECQDFKLYIQIENRIGVDIQIKIKIESKEPSIQLLNQICAELCGLASKYGLEVNRPKKLRTGRTSTLAIVENALPLTLNNEIDTEQLLKNLQNLQQLLDEYSSTKFLL